MKRTKVLLLHAYYNVKQYDFADLAEQIILGLPSDRYEVVSAYLSGHPEPWQPASKAERSVYFQLSTRQLKGLRLRALWQLYRLCRDEQFDVIVANRFKPISMLLLLTRWLPGSRFVGVVHGVGDFDRSYRRRQVQRSVDTRWRFVGVSDAVRQDLLDCGCGFNEANTLAITNAIDLDQAVAAQLPRVEARAQLNLPAEATLIGAIGRLVPVKGHVFLLRAFERIAQRYPDAHVGIIGDGSERQHLEELIGELGLAGRVHLMGHVPDALRFVRAFDVWTMPSLSEGLGLALLEGMSGALPVIASDVPAMRPLIVGAGGIAVEPGDVQSLTSALEKYLELTPEQRRRKGQVVFDYLRSAHSITDYRDAYRRLIGGQVV